MFHIVPYGTPEAAASPRSPSTGSLESRILMSSKSSILGLHRTGSGTVVNRPRNRQTGTLRPVIGNKDNQIRKLLWLNVQPLMKRQYGEENLQRLARDAKI